MMMRMSLKIFFLPCFLTVIAVLYFVFVAPAFADMKEVDEAELSKTKVSVTGAPIKNISCVEKDGVCVETKQDRVTSDKVYVASSPVVSSSTTDKTDVNININGQPMAQFHFGATTTHRTGVVTVTPRP